MLNWPKSHFKIVTVIAVYTHTHTPLQAMILLLYGIKVNVITCNCLLYHQWLMHKVIPGHGSAL